MKAKDALENLNDSFCTRCSAHNPNCYLLVCSNCDDKYSVSDEVESLIKALESAVKVIEWYEKIGKPGDNTAYDWLKAHWEDK